MWPITYNSKDILEVVIEIMINGSILGKEMDNIRDVVDNEFLKIMNIKMKNVIHVITNFWTPVAILLANHLNV